MHMILSTILTILSKYTLDLMLTWLTIVLQSDKKVKCKKKSVHSCSSLWKMEQVGSELHSDGK